MSKPLHILAKDESWQRFFYSVRETNNNLVVFETGNEIRKKCCIEVLEPVIGGDENDTYVWDYL